MGAWQEIADYTVPSNTTSVVLDSFGTITKDDFVKMVVTHVEAANSGYDLLIHANNESTQTNYHTQRLIPNGASVFAGRTNVASLSDTAANLVDTRIGYIKISENDRLNGFFNGTHRLDSSIRLAFSYFTSSGATFPSGITSLTLTAGATNGIGTGSRIQIYKLAAEKVADITVGSNTSQVDISNLSIDKDSEYLLVSDALGNGTSTIDLMINDDTTLTNYHRQLIGGYGSLTFAQRVNDARYLETNNGDRTVAYTHIKLSNIGAYTSQSYTIYRSGTSSLDLYNNFVSSTSEAITSITKLNLKHRSTDGIGAGSTFVLYKLY